jgi:hypothetical protein
MALPRFRQSLSVYTRLENLRARAPERDQLPAPAALALRSLPIVLGVALGVALYVSTEVASRSMLDAFDELVARVAARANLIVVNAGGGISSELVGEVAEEPGVAPRRGEPRADDASAGVQGIAARPRRRPPWRPIFAVQRERGEQQRVIEDPLAFVNDPLRSSSRSVSPFAITS